MLIEYSKIGDSVFVTDDKGNVKRMDNTDNFHSIVMLENELVNSDQRIDEKMKEQKPYKSYRSILALGGSLPIIRTAILLANGHTNSFSPLLTGTLLITYGVSTGIMTGIIHSYDTKIKNIKLYKKALNNEIKYELSRGKKVVSRENEKGFIDNKKSSMRLTYDKYDLMHNVIVEDYLNNGYVQIPIFNEREKRIFSYMVKEEIKNKTKKNKIKEI